jgi:hypothetical protein
MPYFQHERATIREQAWIAPAAAASRVFDIMCFLPQILRQI